MSTIRRWYVYLVSLISLQAVTWAVIALLRNLLIPQLNSPLSAISFEIAVILIGLPLFLAHWLWGQRLAAGSERERGAALRRFYLYGTMAAFLGPFAVNFYNLILALTRIGIATDTSLFWFHNLPASSAFFYYLLALLVLGVLWFYHQRIVVADARAVPETGNAATARRLYMLGFTAAALTAMALALIELLRWIMLQFGVMRVFSGGVGGEFAALLTGVPLWLVFWRWEQRLFVENEEERASALRKFYLYAAVFAGALSVVVNGTAILAGIFRRLLGLPPEGSVGDPLSVIVVMGVVWVYHTFVLRGDASAGETSHQMGVRRLYYYLVAAIGLLALLIGLGGDVSVMLRALDEGFGAGLKDELAWFTASIVAGLPVWILPWRKVQEQAVRSGPDGADARRSMARKIYVYAFLFIATMTVLGDAVFIVFKIVGWMLGLDAPTLTELGHAIAYLGIAVGVWVYHGTVLRGDRRLDDEDEAGRLADLHVAVVDVGEGRFGRAVVAALKREVPELNLEPVALAQTQDTEALADQLNQAGLIVGPWTITGVGGEGGAVPPEISQIVYDSPARKLLIPTRPQGWEWAGVDQWDADLLVRQTVRAVKQIAAGEEVKPARPLGVGGVVGIVVAALIGLIVLLSLVSFILEM